MESLLVAPVFVELNFSEAVMIHGLEYNFFNCELIEIIRYILSHIPVP